MVVYFIGSEPSVRPATEQDLEQIAGLYNSSFPEHILVQRNLLNNPSYLKERIQNPDERWVVGEKNGRITGIAALALCLPIGLGEIERVCVDGAYRGNGIAEYMCKSLVDEAKTLDLGFVEAFARGDQPAMQRTFEKLGFQVYGVSPRFEVVHNGKVVREQFVNMGLKLKPETIDETEMSLIPAAKRIYDLLPK